MIASAEPAQAYEQLSKVISELRPDGVILTPPHSDNANLADLLKEQEIACARVGKREGGEFVDVCMDEVGAGAQVTRHLAELGHTRIAYLAGSPTYGSSLMRLDGYRFDFDIASKVARQWLESDNRPTAIIADNDQMAFAVFHSVKHVGLTIPDDLALVSFEDTPGVRLSVPPMTAIRQPISAMIAKACEGLIANAPDGDAGGAYQLPFELIERDSTAPFSSDG